MPLRGVGTTGALVGATLRWLRSGNRKHKGWENTVLGRFSINESRLVVDVNSAQRRRTAEREVARRLGAAFRLKVTLATCCGDARDGRLVGAAIPLLSHVAR